MFSCEGGADKRLPFRCGDFGKACNLAANLKLVWGLVHLITLITASTTAVTAADPEFGEYLSSQCTTCHQLSGNANGIPTIVGLEPLTFVTIMQAYRMRELGNEAMQNIASTLSDDDIKSLAAYFASIKPKTE